MWSTVVSHELTWPSPPVGAIRLSRFDVHGHQPLPPWRIASCRRPARRAAGVQSLPTDGIWPWPFRSSASIACGRRAAGCHRVRGRCRRGRADGSSGRRPVHSSGRARAPRCRRVGDKRLVLGPWHDFTVACIARVLDAAELIAPRGIHPGPCLEPRLVHLARDRVVLAAEVRHPPGVDDVPVRSVMSSFTTSSAGATMRSTETAPFGYVNCQ